MFERLKICPEAQQKKNKKIDELNNRKRTEHGLRGAKEYREEGAPTGNTNKL